MTREEQLACLEDRPCSVCKFHTDRCNRWTCVFEDEPEEQEPCEDCITLRLEKGALKYSNKDYVVYKKEWLKKWWQPELALLGIELPSIQPKTECSCDQIKWERDTAIAQLKELGYGLGEKPKTGHWISKHIVDDCNGVVTWYECSECGRCVAETITEEFMLKDYPYCHCGAKMLPTDAEKEWLPQYEGKWVTEKE